MWIYNADSADRLVDMQLIFKLSKVKYKKFFSIQNPGILTSSAVGLQK